MELHACSASNSRITTDHDGQPLYRSRERLTAAGDNVLVGGG